MKVRTDFVSNSSSTSFVIAIDKHTASDVFHDIASQCEGDADDVDYIDGLVEQNYRILDFCSRTFQLLFIGRIEVGADEEYLPNASAKPRKSSTNGPLISGYNIVVSNDAMKYTFGRYDDDSPLNDNTEQFNNRINAILKAVKAQRDYYSSIELMPKPDIYCITRDTIQNTRDLMRAGYDIEFVSEWQNLDLLEKKIRDGDMILCVRVGYQGDGCGDFYIYNDSANFSMSTIDGVECIGAET